MFHLSPAMARRSRRPVALATTAASFICALTALTPGTASAATYTINKTAQPASPWGDRPGRFLSLVALLATLLFGTAVVSPTADAATQYPFTVTGVTNPGTVTTTPAGIDCRTGLVGTCTASFGEGTTVQVTYTPDPGWKVSALSFQGSYAVNNLGGGSIGSQGFSYRSSYLVRGEGSTSVLFSQAPRNGNANLSNLQSSAGMLAPAFSSATTSYTATVPFSQSSVSITPTVADSTATVTVNGVATTSGSARTVTVPVGTTQIPVVVTAQDGTKKTYTVAVTRDAGRALTTTLAGAGRGSVTSNPTGINCSNTTTSPQNTCQAQYDTGTQVTLTATPQSGSTFNGFSGGACQPLSATTCRTTLSEARTVTATFLAQTTISAEDSLEGNGVLRATVRRVDDQTGVANQTVTFRSVDDNSVLCTATTNASGQASCSSDASRILAQQPNRGYRATTTGNGTVSSTSNTATLANFTGGGALGT